jgi:hypothetical protein
MRQATEIRSSTISTTSTVTICTNGARCGDGRAGRAVSASAAANAAALLGPGAMCVIILDTVRHRPGKRGDDDEQVCISPETRRAASGGKTATASAAERLLRAHPGRPEELCGLLGPDTQVAATGDEDGE